MIDARSTLRSVLSLSVLTGCLLASAPAAAITNGQPDTTHTAVAAYGYQLPFGFAQDCTAALISPTVVVTAAHCVDIAYTYFGGAAAISFAQVADFGASAQGVSCYRHPDWHGNTTDPDVAVCVLPTPVTDITPATLPTEGLLDHQPGGGSYNDEDVTTVGYGVQGFIRDGGNVLRIMTGERESAVGSFRALTQQHLRYSTNAALGDGGACYGDSGAPVFMNIDGSEVLVGVISRGDRFCTATTAAQRLDTPSVRAFLSQYVTLP